MQNRSNNRSFIRGRVAFSRLTAFKEKTTTVSCVTHRATAYYHNK